MRSIDKLNDQIKYSALYPAQVIENQDPENEGRIRVRIPMLDETEDGLWARNATLDAGRNRGTWFIPDIDDEVLVGFEAGDPRRPVVLGMLWHGDSQPPESINNQNNIKSIISRTGLRLALDDDESDPKLVLSTPGGLALVLSDGDKAINATDANGNTIRMDAGGITITAAAKITLQASQIEASAGALTVDAGISRFSGVVQCDTLITNTVVKPS